MARIWGSGVSFLLHASAAAALGWGLASSAPSEPSQASVAPTVPMTMSRQAPTRTVPMFGLPEHVPSSSIIGTDASLPFTPDHVEEEMELRPVVMAERAVAKPPADRTVRATGLRVAEPVAHVTAPPSEIRNPAPEYPRRARRRGEEGVVTVAITVKADGSCGDIRVVGRSGSDLFVESVMEALKNWVFTPAMQEGVPVEAVHEVRFRFNLEG